jgi:hypothetical protein
MNLVKKRADIVDNLVAFELLMTSSKKEEKDFALNLVLNETVIIVYKVNGVNHFAPVRFTAFKSNTLEDFKGNTEIDDKKMLTTFTGIVGNPFVNGLILEKYAEYTAQFVKKVPEIDRKYWRIKDERGKNLNLTEKMLAEGK